VGSLSGIKGGDSMIEVGETYDSTSYGKFIVLESIKELPRQRYKIKFVDTGYETIVRRFAISVGQVKDPYAKSILGVACLGIATAKDNKVLYQTWQNMLRRVYDTTRHNWKNYGGNGVTICDRWLCFEYFLEDIEKIDGYNLELILSGNLVLDKDSKDRARKLYSVETCTWMSKESNAELRDTTTYRRHLTVLKGGKVVAEDVGILEAAAITGQYSQTIYDYLKGTKSKNGWQIIDNSAKKPVTTIPKGSKV
jgi:hypothetical protein